MSRHIVLLAASTGTNENRLVARHERGRPLDEFLCLVNAEVRLAKQTLGDRTGQMKNEPEEGEKGVTGRGAEAS